MNVETSYTGFCIYCGDAGTTDEHHISQWLGGISYIKKSCCYKCQKIINDGIENPMSKGIFWSPRKFLGLRSSSNSKDPLPLTLIKSDSEEVKVKVPLEHNPGFLTLVALPEPSILSCDRPTLRTGEMNLQFITSVFDPEKHEEFKRRYPSEYVATGELKLVPFMRLLAKIAHGFAIHSGIPFRPLLREFILYGDRAQGEFFVGGQSGFGPKSEHSIVYEADWINIRGTDFLEVRIQLFALASMPVYRIIVGEALDYIDCEVFEKMWNIDIELRDLTTKKEGYLYQMLLKYGDDGS
ncbi:hypothetical protein [Rugamonas aquatica]|uniref:HNH endonuclease n=1 Tax=Rugamonas aquatica TaxID=2743357 RepID=A0A6A7MY56_9BURK|nr:hypothetical protein [Rugamonas aquatica]MQA37665.1 hypothetical protein [Rugamonas aquatica]